MQRFSRHFDRFRVTAGAPVALTATVLRGLIPVTQGLVVFCDANAATCEDSAIFGTDVLFSNPKEKRVRRLESEI